MRRHGSPDGVTLITLEAIPWKVRRNLRDSFEEIKCRRTLKSGRTS